MTVTFDEFVVEQPLDEETIIQAARYYLAEQTDYRTQNEMQAELEELVGDVVQFQRVLEDLTGDTEALVQAASTILREAWEHEGQAESVRSSVEAASQKLPVIETAVLALALMYGLYLLVTRSEATSEVIEEQMPDGTFRKTRRVTRYPAALSSVVELFRASNIKGPPSTAGDVG